MEGSPKPIEVRKCAYGAAKSAQTRRKRRSRGPLRPASVCRHPRAGRRLSYPDYEHVRRTTRTFTDVATQVGMQLRLTSPGGSCRAIMVDFTTGNYFQVLGVRPALGRVFDEDTAVPGVLSPLVVLSN